MGQETTPAGSDKPEQKVTVETPATTTDVVKPAADHMVPKARLDELIEERNALRKFKEDQELKEAEKKGEYDKVLSMYKPKADRTDELEIALTKHLETVIADIPEEKRKMIPADYDVAKKLNYINENRSELIASKDGSKPNTGTPVLPTTNTTAAVKEFSQEQIADPKFYKENERDILKWMRSR